MKNWVFLALVGLLTSCMGVPDSVKVVDNVDANQYLGTWYEIARLDHSFERGMDYVTAQYEMQKDGAIKVTNKGFVTAKKEWKEVVGKAYFIDQAHADKTYLGKLKVSFFGPFYGAYNIISLDKTLYNYVMVCGPNKEYLWIMSRTPELAYPIKQELISEAKKMGFATENLIYVNQNPVRLDYKSGPHIKP